MLAPLLLLAAPAASPGPLMAVLEFRSKLTGEMQQQVDAGYLTDVVRSSALKQIPGLQVMTRENMLVLLEGSGKSLADCEGACEVDTGRLLGADLVVTGEVLRFGSALKLNLRLHETRDGRLLSGAQASGRTVDELDQSLQAAVADLLAPVRNFVPQQQTPKTEAAKTPPAIEAPRPALEQPAPSQPIRLGLYLGGVVDPNAKTFGEQVSLVYFANPTWTFLAGAAISPHPGARFSAAGQFVGGNGWGLALEPRLFVAPFPGGGVQGAGLGLRLLLRQASWLDVIASAAVEIYHDPGGSFVAPLLAIGLEPHL